VLGSLFENLVFSEITRWFYARGARPEIDLVRTKEGVEVDFLVHLGSGRAIAIEAKSSYESFTPAQHRLLDSLGLDVAHRWTVVRGSLPPLGGEPAAFGLAELFERLDATVVDR
jgi:predicted AAA+ superfamily ATPase